MLGILLFLHYGVFCDIG